MRVLVLEYVTGGGMAATALPPSLAREGDLMLRALVKDLDMVPGVEVVTTRDRRLGATDLKAEVHEVGADADPWPLWQMLFDDVDAIWPVAPETGGLLERMTRMAEDAGSALLGSNRDAVALTASKRATTAHLMAHGVSMVGDGVQRSQGGWVVKPTDGAGCEETFFCTGGEEAATRLAATARLGDALIQPYLPGVSGSLSVLCRDGEAWVLACNRQDVGIRDGRFVYRGGTVGGLEGHRKDCEPLAEGIARALPGLWGHAGIDFVLTDDGPVAIEINPRPTTSYCGLREATGINPAELAMALLDRPLAAVRRPIDRRAIPIDLGLCHA